jgi:hypothetical protein
MGGAARRAMTRVAPSGSTRRWARPRCGWRPRRPDDALPCGPHPTTGPGGGQPRASGSRPAARSSARARRASSAGASSSRSTSGAPRSWRPGMNRSGSTTCQAPRRAARTAGSRSWRAWASCAWAAVSSSASEAAANRNAWTASSRRPARGPGRARRRAGRARPGRAARDHGPAAPGPGRRPSQPRLPDQPGDGHASHLLGPLLDLDIPAAATGPGDPEVRPADPGQLTRAGHRGREADLLDLPALALAATGRAAVPATAAVELRRRRLPAVVEPGPQLLGRGVGEPFAAGRRPGADLGKPSERLRLVLRQPAGGHRRRARDGGRPRRRANVAQHRIARPGAGVVVVGAGPGVATAVEPAQMAAGAGMPAAQPGTEPAQRRPAVDTAAVVTGLGPVGLGPLGGLVLGKLAAQLAADRG